ncbi:MAG: Hsp70 family protein, partial [Ruminococcus sp.]|nr:Hsp70 family protein [Ruminococcus sp.]
PDEVIIGDSADNMCTSGNNPKENYISGIKRCLLDKNWSREMSFYDEIGDIQKITFTAPEICTKIFAFIRERIQKNCPNEEITDVVISVPYDYSPDIRNIIAKSASDAGLEVKRLIEEPVAASFCYGVFNSPLKSNQSENIVVVDFGGGTLDITAFRFSKNESNIINIETLATSGNSKLGGIDITNIIKNHFVERLSTPLDNKNDLEVFKYFNNDVKPVISEFISDNETYEIFFEGMHGEFIEDELSLKQFRELLEENGVFEKLRQSLDECVTISGIDRSEYDKIILAGGTCKIMCIQNYLEEYFGKKPFSPQSNDIFELVGVGAGLYCQSLSDNEFKYNIIEKVKYSIGVIADNKFTALTESNSDYDTMHFQKFLYNTNDGRTSGEDIIEIYQCPDGISDVSRCRKIGYIAIKLEDFPCGSIEISLQIKNHDILYGL